MTVVGEAVLAAGGDDDELAGGQRDVSFAEPDVGLAYGRTRRSPASAAAAIMRDDGPLPPMASIGPSQKAT